MSKFIFSLLISLSFVLVGNVSAQQYSEISEKLNIFCIQFPDGSTSAAVYNKKIKDMAIEDFDEQEERIKKQILQNKKRIRTLNKIIKDYKFDSILNSKNQISFPKIYKKVIGKKFNGDADKIVSSAKKAKRKLQQEIDDLFESLESLESCRNGEPLPPTGSAVEIVDIPFYHPDFKGTYYLRGYGIVSTNPKDKTYATGCVALDNPRTTDIGEFPKFKPATFSTDPCWVLNGTIIRGFTTCRGALGGQKSIRWLEWGMATAPMKEIDIRNYGYRVDSLGSAHVRGYKNKKKRTCGL